ncbi:hypothetical protein IHE61_31110 [Streptomyces sp. GKU 257-1]|nr:hypothetical protein [Streptomyces sp. GKU 257-1]
MVTDLPYDPELGLITEPDDDEFDTDQPAPQVHTLAVGQPYAPTVSQWLDGSAELRLHPQNGAEFILFLTAPKDHETAAFTQGNAEFALTSADRHLTWSYRFTNPKNSPATAQGPGIPWSDAPWEYHRQAAQHPTGVPGRRDTPIPLQLILVDADTGLIKGLRRITLPAEFADTLRDALTRQQQHPRRPRSRPARHPAPPKPVLQHRPPRPRRRTLRSPARHHPLTPSPAARTGASGATWCWRVLVIEGSSQGREAGQRGRLARMRQRRHRPHRDPDRSGRTQPRRGTPTRFDPFAEAARYSGLPPRASGGVPLVARSLVPASAGVTPRTGPPLPHGNNWSPRPRG